MPAMWSKALAVGVVAILALSAMGGADARQKKHRAKRSATPALQYDSTGTPSIMRDRDGGISIMRDEYAPKGGGERQEQGERQGQGERQAGPRKVPRGSSTYIPPPVPSPNTGRAIVAPATPGVYKPPPINSFGDRATGCIHSYPLNAGIGNNPTDQQSYIRQCAN